MTRRALLALGTRILSWVCGLMALVPALRYLADPLRRGIGGKGARFRLARLGDLPVGKPVALYVRGRRKDAWKVSPEEILGRVWVVRENDSAKPDQARVRVFSGTCPHLGCAVEAQPDRKRFFCPCHGAAFRWDGQRIGAADLGYENPAPRDLDPLDWSLVRGSTEDELWLEVEFVKFEVGRPERVPKA
jgi:menaquinol-cytochrome c reductase iron-sulfur subunit